MDNVQTVANLVEQTVFVMDWMQYSVGDAVVAIVAKYSGETVVVDGQTLIIGETYTAEMLLAKCASHGAIARLVAPALIARLQSSAKRRKSADVIVKMRAEIDERVAALRRADEHLIGLEYDLDSVMHWHIDADQITPNTHVTVETSHDRRTRATPSVQNKTAGIGRGHRARAWVCGLHKIERGQFAGYALDITQSNVILSHDGAIVQSWEIAGLGDVPRVAQSAYVIMYSTVNANTGDNVPRANLPRLFNMPMLDIE